MPRCKDANTETTIESPYSERLRSATKAEFRKFWSDYRWWITIVGAVIAPIMGQLIRHGWGSVHEISETLENGLMGLVVSLLGTYAIAMRKGAEVLDAAKGVESSNLRNEITRLTPPPRTPAEEHYYAVAEAALKELGRDAIAVLKFLENYGEWTCNDNFHPFPPTPNGMSARDMKMYLDVCVEKKLVRRDSRVKPTPGMYPTNEHTYQIAPGMTPVLADLLYRSKEETTP